MTITVQTKLSDEQRKTLLQSLSPDKIGIIYNEATCYIVCSSLESDALVSALDLFQAHYNIVNNDEVVHTFRQNTDFKLAGNLNLFPLTFTPGSLNN